VALINRRDQNHEHAVALAAELAGRSLLATNLVLVEIADALARNFSPQSVQVIEHFHHAENVEIVHVSPELFAEAFVLYREREDKTWGMTDCVSFVVMQQRKIAEVLTCDQHFSQAGFRLLMRTEP
jgi:predicted nucleic acid-binding protein